MPKEIHHNTVFFKNTVNFLCVVYLPSSLHPLDSRPENTVKKKINTQIVLFTLMPLLLPKIKSECKRLQRQCLRSRSPGTFLI